LPGVIRRRVAPARWLDSTILRQGTPTVRRSACEDERTAKRVGTR
jgi:hypothetical protein